MPTINQIIEKVDRIKPNVYDEQTKAGWLYQLDGRISKEIMKQDPPQQYSYPQDGDRELLVPFPFDGMYEHYMMAMIDYNNAEYGKYNNAMSMYNECFDSFAKAYQREHRPAHSGGFKNVL